MAECFLDNLANRSSKLTKMTMCSDTAPQPPLIGQHAGDSTGLWLCRADPMVDVAKEGLVGIGATEEEPYATGIAQDDGADFEQFQANRGGLSFGQICLCKSEAPNSFQ